MDLQGQGFDCLVVTLFKPYSTSLYFRFALSILTLARNIANLIIQ